MAPDINARLLATGVTVPSPDCEMCKYALRYRTTGTDMTSDRYHVKDAVCIANVMHRQI